MLTSFNVQFTDAKTFQDGKDTNAFTIIKFLNVLLVKAHYVYNKAFHIQMVWCFDSETKNFRKFKSESKTTLELQFLNGMK